MNFLCRTQVYLNSVVSTVNSLAGMVMSDELKSNTETQYKIIVTLTEFEQNISEFITSMKLDSEFPQIVSISKRKFMNINSRLIGHLEKIQFHDCRFENLITILKLENETLEKEIHLKCCS